MAAKAPYTPAQCLARAQAKVGKANQLGMCLAEQINPDYDSPHSIPGPWGWGGNGKAWAVNFWLNAVAHGKVVKTSDPTKVPNGMLVFAVQNSEVGKAKPAKAGHVWTSAPSAHALSTDQPSKRWGKVVTKTMLANWGMTQLGYILTTGDGVVLSGSTPATPKKEWDEMATQAQVQKAVLNADVIPADMFKTNKTVTPITALKYAMEWSLAGRNAALEGTAILTAMAKKGAALSDTEIAQVTAAAAIGAASALEKDDKAAK